MAALAVGDTHQTEAFHGFMGRSHRRGDYRSGVVSVPVGFGGRPRPFIHIPVEQRRGFGNYI